MLQTLGVEEINIGEKKLLAGHTLDGNFYLLIDVGLKIKLHLSFRD